MDTDTLERAACKGAPLKIFFPELKDLPARAWDVYCDDCPIRQQCYEFGKATHSEGVFGGTWFRSASQKMPAGRVLNMLEKGICPSGRHQLSSASQVYERTDSRGLVHRSCRICLAERKAATKAGEAPPPRGVCQHGLTLTSYGWGAKCNRCKYIREEGKREYQRQARKAKAAEWAEKEAARG